MASKDHYRLASPQLTVDVIPHEGGRVASIKSLASGVEFLTQSRARTSVPPPGLDASFQDGPCAGIEECLPTVGPSGVQTEGGPAPDHGDFWQLPWSVLSVTGTEIIQSATGFSRSLHVEKSVRVQGNMVHLAYSIRNVGATEQSFLYACHPLFAVAPGDRIFLPPEVASLQLDYSRRFRLGEKGDIVSWPVSKHGLRLDRAGSEADGTADMLYTGRLTEGRCRLYRAASGQSLELRFDTAALPYLGVWLCYGGWPEEDQHHRQYAIALEPTSSPCNTLAEAQRNGSAIHLMPGGLHHFEISLLINRSSP